MTLRVALAQTEVSGEVPTADVLAAAGARVRAQIERAAGEGARLVCFPEGTLTYPGKRQISRSAPELDDADWSRCDWDAVQRELDAVASASAAHDVWTIVGAPHRLAPDRRPRNSLHLFDPAGTKRGRYDKRMLSVTERTYMYEPGTDPVVFEVDDFRIGTVLCLETLFPELFVEYDALGCDLTVISSAADPNFARLGTTYEFVTGMPVHAVFDGPSAIELVDVTERDPGPTYQQEARRIHASNLAAWGPGGSPSSSRS